METFMYTFDIKSEQRLLKTRKPIFSPMFKTTFNGIQFYWKCKFQIDKNNKKPSLSLYVGNFWELPHGLRYPSEIKCQFVLMRNLVNDICLVTNQLCTKSAFALHDPEMAMIFCKEMIPNELITDSDYCVKILLKINIAQKEFNFYHKDVESVKRPLELRKVVSDKFFDQAIGIQAADGLCDVVLESADGKYFYCHKMILACSSEVFNVMFSRFDVKLNPENKKQSLVEIDDIDGDTITELLRFIYKNEFGENVDNLLEKCLYAAEKYDIPDLKSKCVATLKFNLTPNNVFNYLKLADKFSCFSLKMGCFEVVCLFRHIIDQSEMENFATENPSVYDEIVSFFSKPFDVNLVL